eukprot:516691-Pelagomonas_calceolata.AAC.3
MDYEMLAQISDFTDEDEDEARFSSWLKDRSCQILLLQPLPTAQVLNCAPPDQGGMPIRLFKQSDPFPSSFKPPYFSSNVAKGAGWSREGKSRAVTFDVYDKGLELWAARPSLSFEWFIFDPPGKAVTVGFITFLLFWFAAVLNVNVNSIKRVTKVRHVVPLATLLSPTDLTPAGVLSP